MIIAGPYYSQPDGYAAASKKAIELGATVYLAQNQGVKSRAIVALTHI
jgi:hypothetical protein